MNRNTDMLVKTTQYFSQMKVNYIYLRKAQAFNTYLFVYISINNHSEHIHLAVNAFKLHLEKQNNEQE